MMNVAIFGTGAMGSLVGARLSPYANVTLIGSWKEQIATLNRKGLRLLTAEGEEQIPLRATDDPSTVGKADVALVLTKSAGTLKAARQANSVLAADGIALTLQNGIGNLDCIACEVGMEQAALGITSQGAAVLEPGVVRYAGPGPTYLAIRPDIAHQIKKVAELFDEAGLDPHVAEDVDGLVWGKLAINAAINALTAILTVPNGALLENWWAREMMGEAATETAAVAAAQGIDLPYDDPVERVEMVARMTATNRSSMWQDIARGAPTEIETINGAVMREGQRLGVATPVNHMLYRMVKAVEAKSQHAA